MMIDISFPNVIMKPKHTNFQLIKICQIKHSKLQKLYAFKSIQNNLKAGDFREKISLESHWRTSNLSGCLIRFYADGPKGRSTGPRH